MTAPTPTAPALRLNPDLCTGCAWCVDECGSDVLALESDVAVFANPGNCNGCGTCKDACPSEAITSA